LVGPLAQVIHAAHGLDALTIFSATKDDQAVANALRMVSLNLYGLLPVQVVHLVKLAEKAGERLCDLLASFQGRH
jgi:hypothetical protein